MGNSVATELRRDNRVSSIENLKQIPFIEAKHPGKKKNLIFSATTWKKLVESRKRKSNKVSKVDPSLKSSDESLRHNGNYLQARHASGLPAGLDDVKKSHYVIATKPVNGLSNGGLKSVLQQPQRVPYQNCDATKPSLEEQYKYFSSEQARLAAAQIKDKTGTKREASTRPTTETDKQSAPQPTHEKRSPTAIRQSKPPRKVVIQASTAELLECLGEFICRRCRRVPDLEPRDVGTWLRGVDRSLLMQGWQDITFIMPSSVVFVYMLCREIMPEDVGNVFEVQCVVLTCLYMSYSYMGNEISYPLRPFLIEQERGVFWGRCCRIMNKMSGKMLRINNDAQFFTAVFRDLKGYSPIKPDPAPTYTSPVASLRVNNVRPITVGGTQR